MTVGYCARYRNLTGERVHLWQASLPERAVVASHGGGAVDPGLVGVPPDATPLPPGQSIAWSQASWQSARSVRAAAAWGRHPTQRTH